MVRRHRCRADATQCVIVVHWTPERNDAIAPGASGHGWIVQLVPFHRSTSVADVVSVVAAWPTAQQCVASGHDTVPNASNAEPEAFGDGWTVQVVPFQRSTSVERPSGSRRRAREGRATHR
jgi:hypothetical protein